MKQLFIITLLCLSIQTFAQQNREIGLNLSTSAYDLFKLEENRWITLDVFYKKHNTKEKTVNRWSFSLSKNLWIGDVYWDTLVVTNNIYTFSRYTTIGNIGIKKGIEKYREWNNLQLYYGGDVGVNMILGLSYEDAEQSQYPIVEGYNSSIDLRFSVTPFTGIRIPIGKRFYFTTELGIELGILFENRAFLKDDTTWATYRDTSFYLPWRARYGVNNIGFSYRF